MKKFKYEVELVVKRDGKWIHKIGVDFDEVDTVESHLNDLIGVAKRKIRESEAKAQQDEASD